MIIKGSQLSTQTQAESEKSTTSALMEPIRRVENNRMRMNPLYKHTLAQRESESVKTTATASIEPVKTAEINRMNPKFYVDKVVKAEGLAAKAGLVSLPIMGVLGVVGTSFAGLKGTRLLARLYRNMK